MNVSPYSKHDDELVELLAEALDDLDPVVQQDYLINLLTDPRNKNKTILQVLKDEIKAKRELEADLEERRQKRST